MKNREGAKNAKAVQGTTRSDFRSLCAFLAFLAPWRFFLIAFASFASFVGLFLTF